MTQERNDVWMKLAIALLVVLLGVVTIAPLRFVCKTDYDRDMDKRDATRAVIFQSLKETNAQLAEILRRLPRETGP